MAAELLLSQLNRHRLGPLASVLDEGAGARWFAAAQWLARGGLALRLLGRRLGPWPHNLSSGLYMTSALCFRFAWVRAGRSSAHDDETVARMARQSHEA
jgi:hypothetical protein